MNYQLNYSMKISYLREFIRGSIYRTYSNVFYKQAKIKNGLRLGTKCNFALWGNYKFNVGLRVYLRNFCRIQIENGELSIGDRTFFNNFCTVNCLYKISVGNDCMFGEGVKIYDHNHRFKNKGKLIKDQNYSYGEICIGNNCWIGSNVVILKGVTIGNNVVIGANSVIYKDIPPNHIVKSSSITTEIY